MFRRGETREMESAADWKELEAEEVPSVLAEMAKDGRESVYILNSIRGILKWSRKIPEVVTRIYRPKNVQWERSIIATSEGKLNVALIYSPYDSCSFLVPVLCGNDIIKKENEPMVFFGVPKEFFGRLEHEVISHGMSVTWSFVFNSYWLPAETAKNFKIEVPDGFTLSKLDQSHAHIVNSVWPYGSEASLALVSDTIFVNETVGLYSAEEDPQLVAWILHVYYGLGMLYTLMEHRRRGHGTTVVKAISKRLAEEGAEVTLLAKEDNVEANAVFQKLGFLETGPVQVIQIRERS